MPLHYYCIGEAFLNESQGDIGSLKSSVESLFDGNYNETWNVTLNQFDAFVSNQSTIFITEPDLWSDPSEVISYEIDKTNTEIEATCTAYGGNPEPKFHW